ncbi:MAG: hypothetical protein IIB17_04535, partial [Chloroflexi bacterium]|nr:hypothetical protein [Chloroflexota bacterium]
MSNDFENQEEKLDSFEFDEAGEAAGYISLDQARVLAMRTARAEPGEYGRFVQSPMAFEVSEEEATEDHYVITLAFRPQGEYSGESGREQFFIEKEGNIAHRQVLELPKPTQTKRKFSVALVVGILVVIVAVVAVVAVAASGAFGQSVEDAAELSVAPVRTTVPQTQPQVRTFPTPASTPPRIVANSAQVSEPITRPTQVPEPTAQPTPIAERQATTVRFVSPLEPDFEFARVELPQFGFAFDYPAEWNVTTNTGSAFTATAPNEELAVLAEGQEFDGTLEQLAKDFLTTMESFLSAVEIVDRSERVLRLGNVEAGDQARGILIEFRYRDDDDRPAIGRAFLGTRTVDNVHMAFVVQYMSLESRSDVGRKLFNVALDSLDLFYPEIVYQTNDSLVFTGQVYSEWTDTSAYVEMELEEVDGRLVGYIDIEPPHLGSGDFEGDIDGNQISFMVNFVESD